MESHELEIEIGKDGKVRVHVKGAKGKACLEYAKLIEGIVGKTVSSETTQEYYEPDSTVSEDIRLKNEQRQG